MYFDDDEMKNVVEVIKSRWVGTGPKVKEFEARMAQYVGVKHAIATSNGTAALDVAFKCLEIQPGDEIIIPALTYIATAHAVCYQGAVPVFADIDPRTFTIDPADIERKITRKTRCIIPVDYAGQGPDYDRVLAIARKHKLFVVEDGAPGLCGEYKGKKLCSFGDLAITSFHIAKIFTTVEGGMVFTNSDEYDRRARIIRWQGEDPDHKYIHPLLGFNHRMTDLNAAIGLAQTTAERIKNVLASRKQGADYYFSRLRGVPNITLPHVAPDVTHPWFLFPVLVPNRDKVQAMLLEKGIRVNVSWPLAVYQQEPYKKFKREACPVAERVTREVMCLPLFYQISREEQDYVIEHLQAVLEKCSGMKKQKVAK